MKKDVTILNLQENRRMNNFEIRRNDDILNTITEEDEVDIETQHRKKENKRLVIPDFFEKWK